MMAKRYDVYYRHWDGDISTNVHRTESVDGEYVEFSDYAALEAENGRLREALDSVLEFYTTVQIETKDPSLFFGISAIPSARVRMNNALRNIGR